MDEKKERMLCQCPRGHRLRGSVDLIGEVIRCPQCKEKFVFGYAIRETITDTKVMRILDDGSASEIGNQND